MKPIREFLDRPAVREQVPLLVGLMGPSGCGKTFSALRLATGIQTVTGGDIYGIDTEARRMLHYADSFKFRHLQFEAPFGSLDYLAAVQHCVKQGAKVIVIDSMSGEHEGVGGYLMTHAEAMEGKNDSFTFRAWIKPAGLRRQMINGLLQLNCNFIFCFRAKEKIKPVSGKDPVHMGFMPIAGEEMLFEQTVNCLLLPKSGGIPTWRSDLIGERLMMKLPKQFEGIFQKEQPLSEDIGRQLAEWAKGGQPAAPNFRKPEHAAAFEAQTSPVDLSEGLRATADQISILIDMHSHYEEHKKTKRAAQLAEMLRNPLAISREKAQEIISKATAEAS